MSEIEQPDYSTAPAPAHKHWYRGDLTLDQAKEMFPEGATVRFLRGGGRLLGGMLGVVVGHEITSDPMTPFGGRAELRVRILQRDANAVGDAIAAAIGAPFATVPVQRVSDPFGNCVVVRGPSERN